MDTHGHCDPRFQNVRAEFERNFRERGEVGASVFGHLVGDVVRRVAGKPLDAFFRAELAGPLNLDFHLGLPEANEPRVAPTIKPDPTPPGAVPWRFVARMAEDPQSVQALITR